MSRPIGIAIVGYGFMGATHAGAYARAAGAGHACRVVAVCDERAGELHQGPVGNLDAGSAGRMPEGAKVTTDLTATLARDDVDLVSVCTPTPSHAQLAAEILRAGKHVLVEKPVALDPGSIEELASIARDAGRLCMPAMCMRFWPAWAWGAGAVRDGRFGPVRSAVFQRLGSMPGWSSFYADDAASGGVLFDLHVHDADFVCHCFGTPREVTAIGSGRHLVTRYAFDEGPGLVTAEGSWDRDPGAPFRMRYEIEFERATATFELGREPELTVHAGSEDAAPELDPLTGYDHQARALLGAIASGAAAPPATLEESAAVTRVLLAERESLRSGRPVSV